jgi:hypothetical protein
VDNNEFLNRCGLTEQFGIRHPETASLRSTYDEWFEDTADCFITFADDAEDECVMIHRWVSDTWLI